MRRLDNLISELYLILFLHQTTTGILSAIFLIGCILFYFYIKPQRHEVSFDARFGCILFYFYIKPQRIGCCLMISKKLHRLRDEQNDYLDSSEVYLMLFF